MLVDYVLCGFLNLRGQIRGHFLNFVKKEFPNLYNDYLELYPGGFVVDKEYEREFYNRINRLKREHGIVSNYKRAEKESEQLGLW